MSVTHKLSHESTRMIFKTAEKLSPAPGLECHHGSFFIVRTLRAYFCIFCLLGGVASSVQGQSPDVRSEEPTATKQTGSWGEMNKILHSGTKGEALIGFLVGALVTYGLIRFLFSKEESGEYKPVIGTLLLLIGFGGATLMALVRLLFIWP